MIGVGDIDVVDLFQICADVFRNRPCLRKDCNYIFAQVFPFEFNAKHMG